MTTARYYYAVRKNEAGEWIDGTTQSLLLEESQALANRINKKIPQWAENNPIVRFALFELHEVVEP